MKYPPVAPHNKVTARPLPEHYIADLREEFPALDLTDDQAKAILEPLFEIMAMHVRMGFGLEPVGNLIGLFENSTAGRPILVNSEDTRKDGHDE